MLGRVKKVGFFVAFLTRNAITSLGTQSMVFFMKENEKIAIERICVFAPQDSSYWVGFSGGKDSQVVLDKE